MKFSITPTLLRRRYRRLRGGNGFSEAFCQVLNTAADEIEALRARVRELQVKRRRVQR